MPIVPLRIPEEKFLTPEGESKSVKSVRGITNGNLYKLLEDPEFSFTDIYWLGGTLHSYLTFNWKGETKDCISLMNLRKGVLESDLQKIQELVHFMQKLIVKYGERFYDNLVRPENGARGAGNMHQQAILLRECMIFGTRVGVKNEILKKWWQSMKNKLNK